MKAESNQTFTGVAKIIAELDEPGPKLEREVEEWLSANTIIVTHKRKAIRFGKTVEPGSEAKVYEITIFYKNKGGDTLKDVKIRDIVPEGFKLLDNSMEQIAEKSSAPEGEVITWTFETLQPDQEIEIKYHMKGDTDEFRAGQAQISII
jgi:uncharacterized repeat protein (TIGR01451 family)